MKNEFYRLDSVRFSTARWGGNRQMWFAIVIFGGFSAQVMIFCVGKFLFFKL